MHIKTSNQTIYILESNNSKYKQYFVVNVSLNKERKSAIHRVSMLSNTIVLTVLYNGMIILIIKITIIIIVKSKQCLK